MIYTLLRDVFGLDNQGRETTLGQMIRPDNSTFGYVLEDVVRGHGIKVHGRTAIPAGRYKMKVMLSPKYGECVTLYTHMEAGAPVLEYGGIRFTYIRCHGGNDTGDTEGCLLMNRFRFTAPGQLAAHGTMKTAFANEIKALENKGIEPMLEVRNC
jgi:hypothetical protein